MRTTMAEELRDIADQMDRGDYTVSSEMIVLTRDEETGIVTYNHFGAHTGLLEEAWKHKRPDA